MSSSLCAAASLCFSWRLPLVSSPVKEASPAGGKSARCLRVRIHPLHVNNTDNQTEDSEFYREVIVKLKKLTFCTHMLSMVLVWYYLLILSHSLRLFIIYIFAHSTPSVSVLVTPVRSDVLNLQSIAITYIFLIPALFLFRHWLCNAGD